MVWGCMSAADTGKLQFIEGTINAGPALPLGELSSRLERTAARERCHSCWVFYRRSVPPQPMVTDAECSGRALYGWLQSD